jgi:hypothetical protein
MKVLDLVCTHGHVFEGWFASEDDFLAQCERAAVECPFCGDARIAKKLSAPRLNLGNAGAPAQDAARQEVVGAAGIGEDLQTAWLTLARRIVAQTDDVGERFAEEARRIHYGESQERGIRGQASKAETEALIDEGIAVLPLVLPQALKRRLQ